nr:hypothetical protein [Tanacetum cinerariifolium]
TVVKSSSQRSALGEGIGLEALRSRDYRGWKLGDGILDCWFLEHLDFII